MTTGQTPRTDAPRGEPGYRGSLPTRNDRLARPWILTVIGIFVLVLVLSVVGIPSRLFPEPTPIPLPSLPASGSVEPSASVLPSASATPSGSSSAEASPP
jgi:hypothetical protein